MSMTLIVPNNPLNVVQLKNRYSRMSRIILIHLQARFWEYKAAISPEFHPLGKTWEICYGRRPFVHFTLILWFLALAVPHYRMTNRVEIDFFKKIPLEIAIEAAREIFIQIGA